MLRLPSLIPPFSLVWDLITVIESNPSSFAFHTLLRKNDKSTVIFTWLGKGSRVEFYEYASSKGTNYSNLATLW